MVSLRVSFLGYMIILYNYCASEVFSISEIFYVLLG